MSDTYEYQPTSCFSPPSPIQGLPMTQMPFWDHLGELRSRLLKVVLVVFLLAFAAFWFADFVLYWLLKPAPLSHQYLTSLKPAGVFIQSMRLAVLAGFIFSLPLICYQIWEFVSPGLLPKERQLLLLTFLWGTLLFCIGSLFAYFLVVPKALQFFWNYTQQLGVQPAWTMEEYLNFVLMFLLSFGIAFELPLVIIFLVRFQILSSAWLSKRRPHMIVAIAILAALLTPPDVISQLMLGLPLWLLFELSLLISKFVEKKSRR